MAALTAGAKRRCFNRFRRVNKSEKGKRTSLGLGALRSPRAAANAGTRQAERLLPTTQRYMDAAATTRFTAQDADVLASLVKHVQRTGMQGCKGTWKEFLKVYHSCTGLTWSLGLAL